MKKWGLSEKRAESVSGSVKLSDGKEVAVMTDVKGEVHLTDVPAGGYTFKLDDEGKQGAAGGDALARAV